MSIHRCAGRCGTTVRDADTWCFGCWADFPNLPGPAFAANVGMSDPIQPEPMKDSHQIREEILRNAYILKFGTEAQQIAALESLTHLTFVLKHSQTNP